MSPASPQAGFRPPARVTIVAGKGGVGKTTVSAALALLAARSGLRVLIVDVEGKAGLAGLFGRTEPLSYHESELWSDGAGGVTARTLTPDDALVEYLEERGMRRISKRLTATGTLDVIATAVPGIKDILVLGKVKQIEQQSAAGDDGAPDCIVVDAPAAGHAVSFLSSAYGLLEAAAVGPIKAQAADVVAMLSDPTRCQVMLVTIPEETPVNEAVDTAYLLEDRAGVKLAPIVVNAVWPEIDLTGDIAGLPGIRNLPAEQRDALAAAAAFRRARQDQQAQQLARLAGGLPLRQIRLPYLFTTQLGLADLTRLSEAMRPAP